MQRPPGRPERRRRSGAFGLCVTLLGAATLVFQPPVASSGRDLASDRPAAAETGSDPTAGGSGSAGRWIDPGLQPERTFVEQPPAGGGCEGDPVSPPAPDQFNPWQSLPGLEQGGAVWGDMDGDGDLDLAISGREGATAPPVTRVYENQDSDLILHQSLGGGLSTSAGNLAWGDLDGDGDLDLVVAGLSEAGAPDARLYLNDGTGWLTWDSSQPLVGANSASVAWADYDLDGDLDLVIQGHDGSVRRTTLYRNSPAGTLGQAQTLVGLDGGSADWADWDHDGDPDLLLTGTNGTSPQIIFYRNEPTGTLVNDGSHGLTGVVHSDAAWGDYDNDGDVDLLYTGRYSGQNGLCRLYRNDGLGNLTQAGSFLAVIYSSCAWGDWDNDGDLDFALSGYDGTSWLYNRIYRNDAGSFASAFNMPDTHKGALTWADVDRDGDLDYFFAGYGYWARYALLYRKSGGTTNTAPLAPAVLEGTRTGGRLQLTWSGASDAATPSAGLYYILRVGTVPGGNDIVSGTFSTPLMGNIGQARGVSIAVPPATCYWSVRSVDTGLLPSAWAPEQSVEPSDVLAWYVDNVGGADWGIPPNLWEPMHPDALEDDGCSVRDITPPTWPEPLYAYSDPGPADYSGHHFWAELYIKSDSPQTVRVELQRCVGWVDGELLAAKNLTVNSPGGPLKFTFDFGVVADAEIQSYESLALKIYRLTGTSYDVHIHWDSYSCPTGLFAEAPSGKSRPPDAMGAHVEPVRAHLLAGTPNPFREATAVQFDLGAASAVELGVFDISGRLVKTLLEGWFPADRYRLTWDGRADSGARVASGIYFLRLSTGESVQTARLVRVN